MEADIQRVLDALEDLREGANVNACFGEPVTVEGRTVIPVARVGYGFGVGAAHAPGREGEGEEAASEEEGAGGGGLGAMTGCPLGVIEVTPEGIRVEPVIDRQKVAMLSMLVGAWSLFWLARALTAIFGRRE